MANLQRRDRHYHSPRIAQENELSFAPLGFCKCFCHSPLLSPKCFYNKRAVTAIDCLQYINSIGTIKCMEVSFYRFIYLLNIEKIKYATKNVVNFLIFLMSAEMANLLRKIVHCVTRKKCYNLHATQSKLNNSMRDIFASFYFFFKCSKG